MSLVSINPATGEKLKTYEEISAAQVQEKLAKAQSAFETWREMSFSERGKFFVKAAEVLRRNSEKYARVMSLEMGKPITSAKAEVEKCAVTCQFYAEKAKEFLKPEYIESDAGESFVLHDPLGIILAVMPWNFPFWQVIRAVAPAVMAGNIMVLKHASNVPDCGICLEELFKEAGLPEGVFQNLLIRSGAVADVISDWRVKGATLTGSEHAGADVASRCGKEIKPTVMELGGSDAFVVLADADIDKAAEVAALARFQNCGQSCIAAKRFIVVAQRHDEFLEKFVAASSKLVVGDPLDETTQVGPLATEAILKDIVEQVEKSVEMGARVCLGGKKAGGPGFFYQPTILADVKKGMPVYDQETFGPVAAVIRVRDTDEAIYTANDSEFGLGGSVWTANLELGKKCAARIESGAVFINGLVKSDPRLPFGGVKKSGYGRELSHHGIKEFVNVKTVWVGR